MRYLKPFDLVQRTMFILGQLIPDSTQFHVTRFAKRSEAGRNHDLYPAGVRATK